MSAARETLEKLFYAAIGAGDSWVERAQELVGDPEKREKRIDTLAKRGKKRVSSLEKRIEKRRKEIRKEIEERFSQERLDELVGQAREVIEPLVGRLPVRARAASPDGAASEKKTKVSASGSETGAKAAS